MAMKRCPVCGEKYSDTARECPFCEEDDTYWESEERKKRGGKRLVRPSKQFRLIANTLVASIVLVASSLIYLLHDGVHWVEYPKKESSHQIVIHEADPQFLEMETETQDPVVETDTQEPTVETDAQVPVGNADLQQSEDNPSESLSESREPTPAAPEKPDNSRLDYETAAKLPGGLSLSSADFTLSKLGQTHTIRASGGNANGYTWVSEDDTIVSVDQNGMVKALSGGKAHILVTDGSKKATCIVRVSASGSLFTTPAEEEIDKTSTDTSSGLKTGSAVVINAENGVRVRSGPGTNYKALVSVYNGASIQVLKSAGNDWYEITFYNARGAETIGYMMGEFLKNT